MLLLYDSGSGRPSRDHRRRHPRHVVPRSRSARCQGAFAFRTCEDSPLTFAGAFDWMSDFDKAVAQGMGFRVRLTDEEAATALRKFSSSAFFFPRSQESATLLEELIDNHQFSPKGFSIVPQGTPTNNTERNGTGYSDNDPVRRPGVLHRTDPPAFDAADPDPKKSQTDGRLLADALGISYAPLADRAARGSDGCDSKPHAHEHRVVSRLHWGTGFEPGCLPSSTSRLPGRRDRFLHGL